MIAADDLPVQVACRVLGVSESLFYESRIRPPSERAVRHAMLTDLITQIHSECQRAGLQGISGRKKWRRIKPDIIATDLVERGFDRGGPNQLWGHRHRRAPNSVDDPAWR